MAVRCIVDGVRLVSSLGDVKTWKVLAIERLTKLYSAGEGDEDLSKRV